MTEDLPSLLRDLNARTTEGPAGLTVRDYGDAPAEAERLRSAAGLRLDLGTGVLRVRGRDRQDLLNRLATHELKAMAPFRAIPLCFTNAKGRVLDLVLAVGLEEETLLIGPRERVPALSAWIDRYVITEDVQLEDASGRLLLLCVEGPRAGEAIGAVFGAASRDLERHAALRSGEVLLVRGREDAWQILAEATTAAHTFRTLLERGAPHGLSPVGDDAAEAVRVEEGRPRFGADVTEQNNPLECGLWETVSFNKGCYIGQEVVARLRTYDKVMKHLVLLSAEDATGLEPGAKVLSGGEEAGTITSVASPPLARAPVALALLKKSALDGELTTASGVRLALQRTVELGKRG